MDSGSVNLSPSSDEIHLKLKFVKCGQTLPHLFPDLGLDTRLLEFAFTLSSLRITILEGEKHYALKIMPLPLRVGPG